MKMTRVLYGALAAFLIVLGCTDRSMAQDSSRTITVQFFRENDFRGGLICELTILRSAATGKWFHSGKLGEGGTYRCENDAANSALVSPALTHLHIKFFDSTRCNDDNDDWLDAYVREGYEKLHIWNFEMTQVDRWNQIVFHRVNGLHAKVSCFSIRVD